MNDNDPITAITEEKWYTPQELAARLGQTPHTLTRWRSEGFGPGYLKVGRKIFYPVRMVQNWLAGLRHEPCENVPSTVKTSRLHAESSVPTRPYNLGRPMGAHKRGTRLGGQKLRQESARNAAEIRDLRESKRVETVAEYRKRLIVAIQTRLTERSKDKRRSPGSGTVFMLPNGNWCGFVELEKGGDGTRKRKKFTGRSEQEVLEKIKPHLREESDARTRNPFSAWSVAQLEKRLRTLEEKACRKDSIQENE
jgi:Helix-turn-helix domain